MPASTLTRQERKRRSSARAREREIEKRNYSDAEKRAIRAQHSARIHAALEALESEEGLRAFLEVREINPHLTPLACAIAAHMLPEPVYVASLRDWNRAGYRVRKGAVARAYATKAPACWPMPLFTEDQVKGPDELLVDPELPPVPLSYARALVGSLREAFGADGRKTATLNRWAENLA